MVKEKAQRALGALFVFNALVSLLALAIGQSMVYDNERLFMAAFAYVAALAGIGVDWLLGVRNLLTRAGRASLVTPLLALIVVLVYGPHLALAAPLYPH